MDLTQKRTFKIAAASLIALALVWQHVQATRLGYQVEQSRREANLLKGRIAALRMELASNLSPAQLAQTAKSRLGMFPVSPETLRFLDRPAPEPPARTLLSRWIAKSWRSLLHT